MNTRKIVNAAKDITGLNSLQAIPVVGFVVGLTNDMLNISDRILYKKCYKFCMELNKLTDAQKQDLARSFDETYKTDDDKQEFGERMFEYMNSMNDSYKAILAAKIFRFWIGGKWKHPWNTREMTEDDYYHLLEMMNNIPVDILKDIENRENFDCRMRLNNKYALVQYGLMELKVDMKTINRKMGEAMRRGGSSVDDDMIKETYYYQLLRDAIWNHKDQYGKIVEEK
jgi:hypothetical protein